MLKTNSMARVREGGRLPKAPLTRVAKLRVYRHVARYNYRILPKVQSGGDRETRENMHFRLLLATTFFGEGWTVSAKGKSTEDF